MMPRTVGAVGTETIITVPVNKEYVMKTKDRRFIYLAHVSPKIRELANQKIYYSFVRCVGHGLYNTVRVYGLQAIDIDNPQIEIVSVRLKFALVDDPDSVHCSIKGIKKSTL
jgi:hypothetical protein